MQVNEPTTPERIRHRDFWWPWGCFAAGWFLSFGTPDTDLSLARFVVLLAAGFAILWLARHRFRVERRTPPDSDVPD